ncbi:MAG TPA: hypothetical protein VFH70_07315 [Acidimicrobiales bacterium]|nr:hypothetical protein [Acidimicrobiales bacterium]
MPDEFTPQEQTILEKSPADDPVIFEEDQPGKDAADQGRERSDSTKGPAPTG